MIKLRKPSFQTKFVKRFCQRKKYTISFYFKNFHKMTTKMKKTTSTIHENNIFSASASKNVNKLKLKVGDFSIVNIKGLGTKNIGLAEISNGYTIMVPKAKLGETVKVQIETLSLKPKYATAKLIEVLNETKTTVPVKVEDVLNVTIDKEGPKGSGLCLFQKNFTIIVEAPAKGVKFKSGERVPVKIVRIKEKYALAKPVSTLEKNAGNFSLESSSKSTLASEFRFASELMHPLKVGSSFHIKLPLNAKTLNNYVFVKLKNTLVFIKLNLGAQLGETVRIKILKTTPKYSLAKITKISPMKKMTKQIFVKNTIKQMIASGMHYGEKGIRCHANMRKFLWIRKKGKNQNRPLMKRGRHILNILKTRACLNKALQQLSKYAAKGKTFLFVGTKKPAASLIARTAMLTKTSYFVNTRWLGGMLTNWKTILKSISQIRPILKEKQKMIQKILEKRQKIKKRLLKKVNLLRKKSEKLLMKGKYLLAQLKQDRNILFTRSQNLSLKKTEILRKNQELLNKYSELKTQKQKFIFHYNLLQQKGNVLVGQKNTILQELTKYRQKLEDLKQLNNVANEILRVKKELQNQGKTVWAVPFETIEVLSTSNKNGIIPNPSPEILNKLIAAMKLTYEKSQLTMNPSVFESNDQNRAKSAEQNMLIMSQLLNKLTDYLPFIQTYMKTIVIRIQTLQTICVKLHENIQTIEKELSRFNEEGILLKLDNQIENLKAKLILEQMNVKLLKQKLKQLAAEQKLLKFLPKLRYLPTSKKKMLETVEFLMKKFVDPKMSYSMEKIYDQKLKFTSKKLAATRKQKWQRLEKYFGGIAKMAKMKKKQIANNVVILIGQQEEMNAVRECRKLGMKMFTLVDTNCNPRLSDYIIPANDDSRNSIKYILGQMLTHIRLGQKLRKKILSKRSI